MISIVTNNFKKSISCKTEQTLLELLLVKGIAEINSPCGGNGLCGKCLVQVIEGDCEQSISADEKRLLTPDQVTAGFRLACRMIVCEKSNLTIHLFNAKEEAQVVATYESQYLTKGDIKGSFGHNAYGCAIDIGTTTVVVFLARLDTYQVLDHRTDMNSQRAYGGDVISRIQYTIEHEKGLYFLQTTIVNQLKEMILSLLRQHNVAPESLVSIVAVGNPTMIHLLLGLDPVAIASAPFTPTFIEPKQIAAKEVGLVTTANTQLILPGLVSAYVGSDITTGFYVSQISKPKKVVLFIDIGTNGEIVLWDGLLLYSCSSAAGPAFEGASIRQGMGAISGAIDRVWLTDSEIIKCTTIGDKVARGICGSAIIDVMALLLDLYLVDETGAMQLNHPKADQFLIDSLNGKALKLTETVSFTSLDVREVQLAKAAIAAGSDVLLQEANLTSAQLDTVVIAGGFGSYIDIVNAKKIGLLPPVATDKILTVGNAAGKGALEILMHPTSAHAVEEIRKETHYVELSSSRVFQELYVEHMLFRRIND